MEKMEKMGSKWKWPILMGIMGLLLILSVSLVRAEMRYFTVTASNAFGESGFATEVSIDTQRGKKVTIQWDIVSGATKYQVYWGKTSGDYFPPIDVGINTIHSFIQLPAPTVTIIP